MLGNTFKFLVVIVTFFLITNILADTEEYVEHYVVEEQAINANRDPKTNSGRKEMRERREEKTSSNGADTGLIKVDSRKIENDDIVNHSAENVEKNESTDNKENTKNYSQKSQEDTHEIFNKYKEKRKPLWKIKDEPSKRYEPGFDLTPKEKKKFNIWKGGIIPYYIDVVSYRDKVLRDKIRNYLQTVNSAAGVSFVELPGPPPNANERWVFFVNRRALLGCADHTVKNFTTHGVQQVILGYDCIETRGEMAEAVMSIVGVPAQHNAPDRDKYIQVNMENIMPGKKYLFEKLHDSEWLFHDLGYDFNSITHYDLFKYSANGHPTLQLKNESTDLGVTNTLSFYDLLKIKMLYSYITTKNKLQLVKCEKLFKPRSKFERFVPRRVHVTPRKKPFRYLNLSDI